MSQIDNDNALGTWVAGIAIGTVVVIALIVAYQFGFNRGEDSKIAATAVTKKQASKQKSTGQQNAEQRPAQQKPPAESGPGKELFAGNCGSCHTLAAAGTQGQVGPNLDALAPSTVLVLDAIKNGGTGSGAMPKDLVKGKEAQQIAEFVSGSAGN